MQEGTGTGTGTGEGIVVPVILAGGIGERFWPASRSTRPKQLLPLISHRLMIVDTAERVLPLCYNTIKPGNPATDKRKVLPLIVTGAKIAQMIKDTCGKLFEFDIISEPCAKNTAPAVAAAAAFCQHHYGPKSVMVVVSADHYINPVKLFQDSCMFGAEIAAKEDTLVIFGIKPTRAETGYGYVEISEEFAKSSSGIRCFDVNRFVEKPNKEKAEQYIQSPKFFWNSGMFIWRTEYILKQIESFLPPLYKDTLDLINQKVTVDALNNFYKVCLKESIDFGVMEHAKNVKSIEGTFEWDDIGSWDSLERTTPLDKDHNTISGEKIFSADNHNTIIANRAKTHVAVIGAENMLVVNVDDAVMVIHRDKLPTLKNYIPGLKKLFPEDMF